MRQSEKVPSIAPLLLALILSAGCSDPVGPSRDPAGTYELSTANGQGLPYKVTTSSGLATYDIVSARLTLHRATYDLTTTLRDATRTETDTSSGTYSRLGSDDAATLRFESNGTTTDAAYDGETLTFGGGLTLVYRRR